MRRTIFMLGVLGFLLSAAQARAEWASVSNGLGDTDMRTLAAHPKAPGVLYAASEREVYRTEDGGLNWKRVLGIRGEGVGVRALIVDPTDPKVVYVGGDKGVRRSADGGKHWTTVFKGIGERSRTVYALAPDARRAEGVWIGTADGLFRLDTRAASVAKITAFPGGAVHALHDSPKTLTAAADDGIYRSTDGGNVWEKVFHHLRSEGRSEGVPLEQFDIEEFSTVPFFTQLAIAPGGDKVFAATQKGLIEGTDGGNAWRRTPAAALNGGPVNGVAGTPGGVYAATERGVLRWDAGQNSAEDFSKGLTSPVARAILYDASTDSLFAATPEGVFRYSHPELVFVPSSPEAPRAVHVPMPEEVLRSFAHEPTVLEVQDAAIRYAEVHPDKIANWRAAAAKRALLPDLSLGGDLGRDQNVDLDRGGTNDPDRFIIGPEEKTLDWSVGVSWDLGELVWNDDQTTIDTRSKLMAELRDDILSEVTHLYFERRRLQVQMALSPSTRELPIRLEEELKLQELTARLDALTGGYLSARLRALEEAR